MENFIALEVWVILVAAPCIVSWILGEMHGAARVRKLVEDGALPPVPLTLSPAPAPKSARSGDRSKAATTNVGRQNRCEPTTRLSTMRDPTGSERPTTAAQASRLEQERSRRRRATFEDMPSLAELHAQTQHIRQSDRVWETPHLHLPTTEPDTASTRVLQHYRGSIDELTRNSSGLDPALEQSADGDHPRFAQTVLGRRIAGMGEDGVDDREQGAEHADMQHLKAQFI